MTSHINFIKKSNLDFNLIFDILYKESVKALQLNEVPIAALIYDPRQKKIISKSHNLNKKKFNPCAHAEIEAIIKACKKIKSPRLDGFDIFCTVEPCLMCTSAILQSKIRRIYFSLEEKKTGALINNYKLSFKKEIAQKIKVYYGFNEKKFSQLLKVFLKKKDSSYFIARHPISLL